MTTPIENLTQNVNASTQQTVLQAVADDPVARQQAADKASAINAIIDNADQQAVQNFFGGIAGDATAEDGLTGNDALIDKVSEDVDAIETLNTTESAIRKMLCRREGFDPANFADLDAVAADQGLMQAIAARQESSKILARSQKASSAAAVSQTAMGEVAPSQTAMQEVAASQTAMQEVAASQTAMQEVTASQTAMQEVAASQTAMQEVAASQTTMQEVIASQTARQEVIASQTAMQEVAASQTAMQEVASSQTAMQEVAASQTAMQEVAASQTAMQEVAASQTAMQEVVVSQPALIQIGSSNTAISALENSSTAISELNAATSNVGFSVPGDFTPIPPLNQSHFVWLKSVSVSRLNSNASPGFRGDTITGQISGGGGGTIERFVKNFEAGNATNFPDNDNTRTTTVAIIQ